MKLRTVLHVSRPALLLLGALALAAALLAPVAAGADLTPGRTTQLFSETQEEVFTSEPGVVPGPGDSSFTRLTLFFGEKKSNEAGTATLTCDYNFHGSASCDAILHLAHGDIVAIGRAHYNTRHFDFAIVGGTGAYRGSTGELRVVASGVEGERYSVDLDPGASTEETP